MGLKLKRLLAVSLTIILCLSTMSMFSGCGKKGLRVFLFGQSHEVAIYEELAKRFTEKTGIEVDLTIEEENYFDLLRADLISGDAADVFYVRPGDVRANANLQTILNLSESGYVTESDVEPIWDQAIDFFRYDGTKNNQGDIYALPKDYSQYVLGFNYKRVQGNTAAMARIEPYLYNPEVHGAWDTWEGVDLHIKTSYLDNIENITPVKVKLPGLPGETDANGNNIVYTFDEFAALSYLASNRGQHSNVAKPVYGTAFWEDMCLMAYVWGNGGEFLIENNTKVNFTDKKVTDAYQAFIDLDKKWNGGASGAALSGYNLFTAGDLVFYPVGTWDIGYFNTYSSVLDYKLMPWPISNDYANSSMESRQDKWKARVDSVGYGVYSGSKHIEDAVSFIKFLSLNEDIQRYLASTGIQIPNIESMARGDYLNNVIKDSEGNVLAPENKQLLLDVAEGASGNGHFGPTVFTYNDEWFSEFFTGAVSQLWDSASTMTVAEYALVYAPYSQNKLDEAIALEQQQKLN